MPWLFTFVDIRLLPVLLNTESGYSMGYRWTQPTKRPSELNCIAAQPEEDRAMATVMLDRQCRSALHCSGSAPGTPFTTNLSVLYNRAASDNARCRLGQQREGCSRVLDVAVWPVIRNSDVTHEPGSTDRLAMQPVQDRSSHGTLTLAS